MCSPIHGKADEMTAAELRTVITASGFSASRWAREVVYREPRTVRRWLSGESPIPQSVARAFERQELPGTQKMNANPASIAAPAPAASA